MTSISGNFAPIHCSVFLKRLRKPAIIEWHPSRPLLACTSIEAGTVQIWGIEPQQKWSALAPDFTEVTENVEYIEREDEFDVYPEAEHQKRRLDREDEVVDILSLDRKVDDESFVLPVLLDIEDSEEDDQELVRMGVGTMRKKEVNEGKLYEGDQGRDGYHGRSSRCSGWSKAKEEEVALLNSKSCIL